MTSNTASNSQNASISINQPLHYFTGKIRAFWKNLVFFSDPRNVAFAEVRDVYFNGKRASIRDLGYLEELVQRSNWSGGGPELHSYVFDYHSEIPCPWPHELSGKRLWKAKCAWFGFVPNGIKEDFLNNIVYMPLSYYTGTIKEFYDDKILFGDARNSVMVSLDNFYGGRGGYSTNTYRDSSWPLNDTIHAYVIKLDVLSDSRLIGPEPHLPTWPKGHFSPDMWVAKFAWQGDLPELVKDQVERFYVIRMNRWVDLHSVPWIVEDYDQNNIDNYSTLQENSSPEEKGNVQETETGAFIPVEQKPGLMKGSLLLADENEGLMTSFVDLIAFNKESFYINGKKFIHNYDLSYFFQDRIIPLTAWVIPLDKPKVIFNIKVVWQAVCVWCGIPPKHLENIKKKYVCEKVCNNSLKTSGSVSFMHFIGKVKSLSYASGVLISRAGLDQQVKISFKRKAVYIHGSKFHSSCSLLDKQQLLENSVWSVLAYPVWTDDAVGIPHYRALAMWHYDDQHCMNLLFKTISDFVDLVPALQNTKLGEARNYTEGKKLCQNISGWIAKVTENYGIIQSGSALVDATYLYFKKEVLYIDGELLPKGGSLQSLKQGRQCNVQANVMPPRDIDGYQVTMEATLVWIGRKPSFESNGEVAPQSSPGSPSHVNDAANDGKPSAAKTKTESCVRADKILRAAEGVMVGHVLMADEEHGLIISSDIIIGFSRDIFYINGNKFKEKDSSLKNFCSDRKITVRAMIVTLSEPKVLLNCFVMCEAVCVWIGQEPDDLAVLQKVCDHEKPYKAIDFSKMSHISLLYFMGRMTPVSKDVTLLASTTPEGTAKIFMSKENLFVNGASVHQNDVFEQCKKKSQNWCVFAVPIPPRDMNGHSVKYNAVAVWDMSYHHKMRTVLLSAAYSLDKSSEKECSTEHDRACMKNKANGVSDNKIEDITKALSNTLGLGRQRKDHSTSLKMSSQLKDSSVIVSHLAKTPPEIEGCDTFKLGDNVSEQEFCGKHVAGYIIKKTEGGGIAQWKSLQFEGFVFIEFSRKSLYLDMKPMNNKWKVADVTARPCNLYVIPVPHHNVEKCIVSLKATCGWIGKKPLHFPSPGTQLLTKIDLSSVHVTQAIEVENTSEDEFDVHDDIDDDGGLDDVEIPLEGYQNDNIVNTRATSGVSLKSELSQSLTEAEGNIAKGTHNEQLSKVICSTQNQAPPLMPQVKNKIENKSEDIRENKNKNKNHQSGTIAEAQLSVGQLKGDDGRLHYFSRDSCYLYGVSLGNVELWHVLAPDDPVHYSVTELVPGMVKVQRVWIGFYDQPSREIAAEHIFAWCHEKSVPDGARDILVSQLEAP